MCGYVGGVLYVYGCVCIGQQPQVLPSDAIHLGFLALLFWFETVSP